MELTSDAFEHNQRIPDRHARGGDNVSPALRWSDPPAGTRELALILDDPDAPRPEPFVHWVIYKIDPAVGGLPEGVPKDVRPNTPGVGLQGVNSWDEVGYDGPAPPPGHGVHHYHFQLYALDKPLETDPKLDKKGLIAAMQGHILDRTVLTGTYER